MKKNLFGEEVTNESVIRLIYKGDSFAGGQMQIRFLYTELQSLERIIKNSVNLLVENEKLDASFKNVEIYIQITEGSMPQVVKIVFGATMVANMASDLLVGLINTTYDYFLNLNKTPSIQNEYRLELEQIKGDKQFKDDLRNILSPIGKDGDSITIQDNHGTINLIINRFEKEEIVKNLEQEEQEDSLLKNGEFEEELVGVIRKLDLDAQKNNYFGFNIKDGPSKIPTSIKGEFNLNVYKELLNEPVRVRAIVKYKDDIITHIEVLEYEILNKSKQSKLFDKSE